MPSREAVRVRSSWFATAPAIFEKSPPCPRAPIRSGTPPGLACDAPAGGGGCGALGSSEYSHPSPLTCETTRLPTMAPTSVAEINEQGASTASRIVGFAVAGAAAAADG